MKREDRKRGKELKGRRKEGCEGEEKVKVEKGEEIERYGGVRDGEKGNGYRGNQSNTVGK